MYLEEGSAGINMRLVIIEKKILTRKLSKDQAKVTTDDHVAGKFFPHTVAPTCGRLKATVPGVRVGCVLKVNTKL